MSLVVTPRQNLASFEAVGPTNLGGQINASGCTSLESLTVENQDIDLLNITNCDSLKFLNFNSNLLTSFNFNATLENVNLNNNQLTQIKAANRNNLKYLFANSNNIGTVEVTNCTSLQSLNLNDNNVSILDISTCTSLETLNIENNQLGGNLTGLGSMSTSLLVSKVISIKNNNMTAQNLNDVFNQLPTKSGSSIFEWSINIHDNLGVCTCDWTIAKNKGWLVYPELYTLTSSVDSVNEGVSVTFTLNASKNTGNVAYTISGITSDDIGGASLTGSFVLVNGSASVTFNITNDVLTEGTETMTLSLNGVTCPTSKSVIINDTSISELITFTTYSAANDLGIDYDYPSTNVSEANGYYFIMGGDRAWSSTDGITWTRFNMPVNPRTTWNGIQTSAQNPYVNVIYANNKYVTVSPPRSAGYNESSFSSAYSNDGVSWTGVILPYSSRPLLGGVAAAYRNLAYGGGKFLTMGPRQPFDPDVVCYSSDGVNWTAYTIPSSIASGNVIYAEGKFITKSGGYRDGNNVYYPAKVSYSTNGLTWNNSIWNEPSGDLFFGGDIVYGNGKFVTAVDGYVAHSDDGINWNFVQKPSFNLGRSLIFSSEKGLFYSLAFGYILYYSENGIDWTETTWGVSNSVLTYSRAYPKVINNGKMIAGLDSFGRTYGIANII